MFSIIYYRSRDRIPPKSISISFFIYYITNIHWLISARKWHFQDFYYFFVFFQEKQPLLPPPVFRSKRSIFEYGNYDKYYNYRHETQVRKKIFPSNRRYFSPSSQAFVDARLSAIMQYLGGDQLEFFHDKTVLDIGWMNSLVEIGENI